MNQINILDTTGPFGKLSNNYNLSLNVNQQIWKTVTHFIYYNLSDNLNDRNKIKEANTNDVVNTYNILQNEQFIKSIRMSVDHYLNNISTNDMNFQKILLKTKNKKIIYNIRDTGNDIDYVLGITALQNGNNLLGTMLQQQRKRIISLDKIETEKQMYIEQEHHFYMYYIAYKQLSKIYLQCKDDLSSYENLDISQIHKKLNIQQTDLDTIKKTDKKYDLLSPKNKQIFKLKFLNTHNLLLSIKKDFHIQLSEKLQSILEDIILDLFLYKTIKKHKPEIPYKEYKNIKTQQIDILPIAQIHDLQTRLLKLYNQNKLDDEDLHRQINNEKQKYNFITFQDIENIEVTQYIKDEEKDEEKDEIISFNDIISDDNEYNIFSPYNYKEFIIDSLTFPNLQSYIIFNLFLLFEKDKNYIYNNFILKNIVTIEDVNSLYQRYMTEKKQKLDIKKAAIARHILNEKFEKNYDLKKLLLSTNDKIIIWNDKQDDFLGVGYEKRQQNNFVGEYLMSLRSYLYKHETNLIKIYDKISVLLDKDVFLKEWVIERINKMIDVLTLVLSDITDLTINSSDLINDILSKFFKCCYEGIEKISENTIQDKQIPFYIKFNIKKRFKRFTKHPLYNNINKVIVDIISKKVITHVTYIFLHMKKNNDVDIMSTIKNSQYILSNINITPNKQLLENERDNKIINVIINILKQIDYLNRTYGTNKNISIDENKEKLNDNIILSLKILLNKKFINYKQFYKYNIEQMNHTKQILNNEFKNLKNVDTFLNNLLNAVQIFKEDKSPINIKNNRLNFYID